jgi:hypothetical protein
LTVRGAANVQEIMRVPAAYSSAVRPVLAGSAQPAEWLGASACALYLITRRGDVLAVLTHDAVRLPCALVVSGSAAELPVTRLLPAVEHRHVTPASVGAGRVEWAGPGGVVTIAAVREWAPARVAVGAPRPAMLDALTRTVAGHDIGVQRELVGRLAQTGGDRVAQYAAVAALLGRGPGLTPSGDDVVAGFLLGARAFGIAVPGAVAAVVELARGATTALSAQLLEHAVRGECVPEVAAAAAELSGRPAPRDALTSLLAVGHTTGPALAAGLTSAAASAAPTPSTQVLGAGNAMLSMPVPGRGGS